MTKTLTITYDKSNEDIPVMCVAENNLSSITVVKMVTGEKAEQLYKELTGQNVVIKPEKEPTTKNDIAQERYQDLIEYLGDEKVAKTILESRKEFKAWLERLRWNTQKVDELARELEQLKSTAKNDSPKYCDRSICLKNEYNNVGCEDCEVTKSQEPTTKNDLGVDCISRQAISGYIDYILSHGMGKKKSFDFIKKFVTKLPSVTPQEPSSDMEEISEALKCDADAETKCKMISNILNAKPHYFKPKTGHWIVHPHEAGPCWEYSKYECSECHVWEDDDSDYCPNCGVKMVEPQEGENT